MRSIVLLASAFALCESIGCASTTGGGGACTSPAGTYGVEVVSAGGSCGPEFGSKIAAMMKQDVEKKAEPCGQNTKTFEGISIDGTDCTMKGTSVVTLASDGYKGTSDLTVNCTDGSSCTQKFTAYYTKR